MTLRPEIVNILQREKAVCGTAMMRLQEKIRPVNPENLVNPVYSWR